MGDYTNVELADMHLAYGTVGCNGRGAMHALVPAVITKEAYFSSYNLITSAGMVLSREHS